MRQLAGLAASQCDSKAPVAAGNDHEAALVLQAFRHTQHERIDRSYDTALRKIEGQIRRQPLSVEQQRQHKRGWENRHPSAIYRIRDKSLSGVS
jgi:hypothetical protein